ncbi:acyl-CoA thioester hydrolase [Spirosomataceae bacterium TFI 002]|nr:acyl-CoA thioester hydrolase [Spirosomataceae bacterium TFI 002]
MSQPKEHCIEILVNQNHLDELNHVNNVVYFEFLQEAAIAHWHAIAPDNIIDSVRWVVKKHEIEYFKPAFLGDLLKVKTWVQEFTAISSLRCYEITRGEDVIAKANTLWIALGKESMKPQRLDKSVSKLFFE